TENGVVKSRVVPGQVVGAADAVAAGAPVEATEIPGSAAARTHGRAIRIPVTLLRMGCGCRAQRNHAGKERDAAKQVARKACRTARAQVLALALLRLVTHGFPRSQSYSP